MPNVVVVTGATGNVGKELAGLLLGRGVKVRVVARSADKLKELASRGAEPAVGSVDDAAFLARAFDGASAVFAMVPPNYAAPDHRAYQRRVIESVAGALEKAGTPRAVSLSSVGADQPSGTGPITGLHLLEQGLNAVRGLHMLHLRPTFFMENTLPNTGLIKSAGIYGASFRPDLPMAMIATRDIAAAAADVLANPTFTGHGVRELLGPREYTWPEATRILGQAIGKPDLPYVQFPYEEVRKALGSAGLAASVADDLVELARGFNEGRIRPLAPRSPANTTPTTLEEFARTVFAPAYKAG